MLKKYSWAIILLIIGGVLLGKYIYKKPKFINGETTPMFSAKLIDGSDFDLESLKGKYVLIDFWGSWCGPCRAQSKALVSIYKKFNQAKFENADGFEIVSIGIETKETRWKKAIEKDGKYWPYHILDQAESLRFFDSPIAGLYGIKEVPTKYLLNGKGDILGVNLPFEEMDKLLTKRMVQN